MAKYKDMKIRKYATRHGDGGQRLGSFTLLFFLAVSYVQASGQELLFFQISCQEEVDRRIIYLNADIIIQHLNLPGQDIDSGNHLVLSYSCPLDSSARR